MLSMTLMAGLQEQCICIEFCFILGVGGGFTEARKMLKRAIGDNAMGRTWPFDWFP